ncbi:MAG: hypothetical protein K8W52_12400 [Deltaproteobacteria bacterium]|nr:hypothetical protein [Deltaproteobacteria bacterium]
MAIAIAVFAVLPRTAPGAAVGHALGIAGFALMIATEVAYSLRKRARTGAWGPMQTWLRVHIFTGIVGPALVLLHTNWRFSGLAGATAIAVMVVVVSGFVGRYLYTALPRTTAGEEMSQAAIAALLGELDTQLSQPGLAPRVSRQLTAARDRLKLRVVRIPRHRRLLALWHTVHVPLGVGMFVLGFAHVAVALYYGAGLR